MNEKIKGSPGGNGENSPIHMPQTGENGYSTKTCTCKKPTFGGFGTSMSGPTQPYCGTCGFPIATKVKGCCPNCLSGDCFGINCFCHTKPEQQSSLEDIRKCCCGDFLHVGQGMKCEHGGYNFGCAECLNALLAQAKAESYKEGVKEGRVLAVKYLKDAMEREFEETGGEIGQLELEDLFEAAIAPEVSRDEQ